MTRTLTLVLPLGPTVNTYWRRKGMQYYIAPAGRRFRNDVLAVVVDAGRPKVEGRLRVSIIVHPSDRRHFDLDNKIKAVLDSLAHAGVFADDEQVDDLRIVRGPVRQGGQTVVTIEGSTVTYNVANFARNLTRRRKEIGVTQRELARAARTQEARLSSYETGRQLPSLEVLLRICSALEVGPNDLLRDGR